MGEMRPLLKAFLKPLEPFLKIKDLVEISVNKSREIGLEIAEEGYRFVEAPELDFRYWTLLCHVLANGSGVHFDPMTQPRVSTALPGGHRFEAMVGKAVKSELSISIRLRRNRIIPLEDFGLEGEWKEKIIHLVQKGANIIISGGTSSGKTTFLNQLIRYIPTNARILTVEDTAELEVPHHNLVNYVISRNEGNPTVGYSEVIDHLVRSRPDVIIAGEVSVANSFPLVRMLNTGHSGFMSTIHSNTPALALNSAMIQNIKMSGINSAGIAELLHQVTDLVCQLHRLPNGKRSVTELFFPKTKSTIVLEPEVAFK